MATIAPLAPTKPSVAPTSPTPKSAVAPSPPATAAPHPEPTPDNYMGDAMDELQAMTQDTPDRLAPKRDPKTGKFEKPKASEPTPEPEPQAETELKKEPEPETTPRPEDEPKPGTMRALGKAYDALKKERDEVWHPQIQKLKAENEELKNKPAPDIKPIQDRMAQMEKENAALREEIRFVNYRKHPEFAEKYEKPYTEAWGKAVSEIEQLTLFLEDGTKRKATANDLLAIAQAPLDQLDELAEKWFGKSAPRVIRHIEKVRDLAEAQDKALEDAKKGAGERETLMGEQARKQSEAVATAYSGANAELVKKYPRWFAPIEGDNEGNEVLRKGYEYADSVFNSNGISPEQKAKRLAIVRAKAANHDRMAMQMKQRNARITELEASLAEYEQSEPPTDKGKEVQPAAVGTVDDWETELKKLAK